MILLDRVTKSYTKRGPALERISLHVEAKEFVIIVGQSGAGKSTLFKLLTREEKPTSGKIIVGGMDYESLRDKDIPLLRRKIGVVFQDFKLLPNKTVHENVAFALEIAGIPSQEIKHTVPKVLDIVGLSGKESNYEPTGNLDPKHAWDVIKVLEKVNRFGTTVLLTTHNMEIVNALKRRVVTIKDGHIVSDRAGGQYRSN
jgi:cell division transport system ATP-binding protein